MYEQIGTTPEQKRLVILEHSGHLPMLTEPEELARVMLEFLEK